MTKTPDLKPCPFCGRPAAYCKNDDGLYVVGCLDDHMCMGNINHITMVFVSKESAIATWNRRPPHEENPHNL